MNPPKTMTVPIPLASRLGKKNSQLHLMNKNQRPIPDRSKSVGDSDCACCYVN